MSNSRCAQNFHGLANDLGTSDLPGMRHEAEPGRARSVEQARKRRCGYRLVAYQADADHSFGGERDAKRSLIGGRGPATDELDQPGDLDPELPGDRGAAADDAIDPSISWVQAGVEADLGIGDVLGGHGHAVL